MRQASESPPRLPGRRASRGLVAAALLLALAACDKGSAGSTTPPDSATQTSSHLANGPLQPSSSEGTTYQLRRQSGGACIDEGDIQLVNAGDHPVEIEKVWLGDVPGEDAPPPVQLHTVLVVVPGKGFGTAQFKAPSTAKQWGAPLQPAEGYIVPAMNTKGVPPLIVLRIGPSSQATSASQGVYVLYRDTVTGQEFRKEFQIRYVFPA